MRLGLRQIAWLVVPLASAVLATNTQAQNRAVKVTISVVKGDTAMADANVTLTPDTGAPAMQAKTDNNGVAVVTVPVGPAGWFSSAATIKVTAEKDSETASETIKLWSKDFKAGAAEVARTLALKPASAAPGNETIELTVKVTDDDGHAVSSARVNIYQGMWSGTVVVPPMLQQETDVRGLARIKIPSPGGQAPSFSIEVGREDMQSEVRNIAKGAGPQMLEQFFLKGRSKEGREGAIVNVIFDVNGPDGPIEGASVLIWDTSLGAQAGRFAGSTGANGKARIPVLYGTEKPEQLLEVNVSKSGYKDVKKFITLKHIQIGTTVEDDGATLEKVAADSSKVTVTVTSKKGPHGPIGDAKVVLDGGGGAYYSDTTGGTGTVVFQVAQPGSLKVRISHGDYLDFSGETRLLPREKEKSLSFELEPKTTKDQGEDTIEVTVLGKDSADEKSKPAPIKGAYVKAGTISAETDESGVATLTAAFAEMQEVTVQANGYKIKTQNVRVNKVLHMSTGSGKATFTLEQELSDTSPIRLSVEVRDAAGKPLPRAKVDISTAGGEHVAGGPADDAGNFLFDSSEVDQELAVLRQGLVVDVKTRGYAWVEHRSIPAEMLKPSTKTGEFLVQLDRDWSDLLAAINALEPRVLAWNNNLTAAHDLLQGIAKLQAEVNKIGQRATRVSNDLDQMRPKFSGVNGKTNAGMRCEEAARLKKNIGDYSNKASEKEKELRKALDKAQELSATCTKADDAEQMRKSYDEAIKLAADIGILEKKAVKDSNTLKDLAKDLVELKDTSDDFENKLNDLAQDAAQAAKVAASAKEVIGRAQKLNDSLKSGYLALRGELDKLKKTFGLDKSTDGVPPEMLKRVETMEKLLAKKSGDVFAPPSLDSIKPIQAAADAIKSQKQNAQALLAHFQKDKRNSCDIDSMDDTVEAIGAIVSGTIIELAAAADLPNKVNDCAKKIADASNQVEVPDLSTLNDLGAMTRAADQAGLVLRPIATNQSPPAGSQRLFGPQNPAAKAKAKRGDPLTIPVYQKLVAQTTPSPTPVEAASASPKPADDYVDVPSVAGAPDAAAMRKILEKAGFNAVFNAATPKTKTDELKFAGQDPVGRIKKSEMKQRENQVVVSINQKWQLPVGPSATPSSTPMAATSPSDGRYVMPSLIDLTIEQASALLPATLRIGSDQIGGKLTPPEKALLIYYQYPPAKQLVDPGTSVTIKRFGEADAIAAATPVESPTETPSVDPGNKAKGPTDITNTTGGEFWAGTPAPKRSTTPSPSRTPAVAKKKSPTPAPSKKKGMSDWWRQHGHNRPDYEVPNR